MRDPAMLVDLLKEMADQSRGHLQCRQYLGMSDEDQSRYHHVELLVDAGHAAWLSPGLARITNDGYDFIQAIDKQQAASDKFSELFHAGATYLKAAMEAVNLANKLAG